MTIAEIYYGAFWALWVIIVTILVQGVVATVIKARQPGAIPGKMPEGISHESLVFRSHRAFHNSLENAPLLLGTVLLAFLVRTPPGWTALLLWTYALARILYTVLYYLIATERNPSPRSYLFGVALAANVALLALCATSLMSRGSVGA